MKKYLIKTPLELKTALRRMRHEQKLTQSEFGRKVGLSQERVSAIENHPERLTVDQLTTLLMALGMELVIQSRALEIDTPGKW